MATMTLSSKNFRIRRGNRPDATFDGCLLADVSSENDTTARDRWTEIRIYRTQSGKYISEIVGRSILPGEKDRITFNVAATPAELEASLHINNRPYLTDLAVEALEDATALDPALASIAETID